MTSCSKCMEVIIIIKYCYSSIGYNIQPSSTLFKASAVGILPEEKWSLHIRVCWLGTQSFLLMAAIQRRLFSSSCGIL